jgi:hypothetical protein
VLSDTYFAQLLRYVARNPVAARLCATPEAWPWSGHRALMFKTTDRLVARTRVEDLLAVWGGADGSRYAALFDPLCPLEQQFGDASPWEWRPPLNDVMDAALSVDEGMRAARDAGYRLGEIGAFLGIHESTVSRRSACKKGA